ncbi:MAG TPA: hypothetical protein VJC15_01120 [Candidatus Paceibacterota bacterium]
MCYYFTACKGWWDLPIDHPCVTIKALLHNDVLVKQASMRGVEGNVHQRLNVPVPKKGFPGCLE